MKRLHAPALLCLLSAILLTGCSVPSLSGSETAYPHEPVKGTYGGKTIEMSYAFISDIDSASVDFYKPRNGYRYVNGYVILLLNETQRYTFMDKTGETIGRSGFWQCDSFGPDGRALIELENGTWATINAEGKITGSGIDPFYHSDTRPSGASRNIGEDMYLYDGDVLPDGYTLLGLMDRDGHKLTETIFKNTGIFTDGLCFAKLAEGEHKNVVINTNGEIVGRTPDANDWAAILSDHSVSIMSGEPGAYYFQVYDFNENLLNETRFDLIGGAYHGLALILQNGKIGLIDVDGEVVIPPVFDYDKIPYDRGANDPWIFNPTYMDGDIILIPVNGKVGALKITRF